MTAINGTDEYTAATVTSNESNTFFVQAVVAGGTTVVDVSPLAPGFNNGSFPSIVYDLDGSTVSMVPDAAGDLDEARNDGLFQLPTVAPTMINGMRVSVKNTGSIAFATAPTVTGAYVSNTALTAITGNVANGELNDFDRGVNTPTGSKDGDLDVAGEMIYTYVAAFTDINPGGSVTATKLTNRLGW